MRILVVGNGGREHALLWKIKRDEPSAELYSTQPNAGGESLSRAVPIAPTDVRALAGWAASQMIDLVVVGPEAPLAAGLVDVLRKYGVPAFGPTADAARIESSKAFAKQLMVEADIPTAAFAAFDELGEAERYVEERGAPIVIKASGLAAGKGAVVCATVVEARKALTEMMSDRRFGEAGREVVVEEFMEGEELSVFAICDGQAAVPLLASQDHKRVGEGDTGPNTGGMGAYAPVSLATPELLAEVKERVLLPTLGALEERGAPFRGLLYAGLMLTPGGPKVVEFNCRFGDPETQVVLPLMKSALLPLLQEVALGGSIAGETPGFGAGAAVATVLASAGYPGPYEKGKTVHIPADLEADGQIVVFHAGTRRTSDGVVSSGGRVLAVTGLGGEMSEAADRSRAGARAIAFDGKTFRSDIGWRELARTGTVTT